MRRTSMSGLVRRLITLSALTALGLLLVGATQAGAAVQRSDGTTSFSFAQTNPCNGETGTLSGTETVSTLVDDTAQHSLYESTALTVETFTPDNPAEPTATGHGAGHVSFLDNNAGGAPFSGTDVSTDVSTSVFHAAGATLVAHDTVHVTVVDGGTLVVLFNRPVLVCEGLS
jgi:hypothetical protein